MRSLSMALRLRLGVLLAGFVLVSSVSAQTVGGEWEMLHRFVGVNSGDSLGGSVADAGDVDGDGFADLILGAPGACPNGLWRAGSAYVYSGRTGALLWQFDGDAPRTGLGRQVSGAGDVDGDGYSDLLFGAPRWKQPGLPTFGTARVHSGRTGTEILRFEGTSIDGSFPTALSAAGDIDGDSFSDLLIAAAGADPGGNDDAGAVYMYSGGAGTLIRRLDGAAAEDYFGSSVAAAGDVDGDGVDDAIIGALGADPNGFPETGSAYVYSGASGALLWQFDGPESGARFGTSVSEAGDVDQDGYSDVIIGAPERGLNDKGSAYVYSGRTGSLIWRFDAERREDWLGASVSGAGDADGDEVPDLLVGAPRPHHLDKRGHAQLFSGATGGMLREFRGGSNGDRLGISLALTGDLNGDGLADGLLGAVSAEPAGVGDAGAAYVFSFQPFLRVDSRELSSSSGVPLQFDIDFPDTEAGRHFVLLASATGTGPTQMGAGGVDVPLTRDGLFNRLLTGWTPFILSGSPGLLGQGGEATVVLQSDPVLTPYVGRTIHLAAVSWGPAFRLSSIARTVEVVP